MTRAQPGSNRKSSRVQVESFIASSPSPPSPSHLSLFSVVPSLSLRHRPSHHHPLPLHSPLSSASSSPPSPSVIFFSVVTPSHSLFLSLYHCPLHRHTLDPPLRQQLPSPLSESRSLLFPSLLSSTRASLAPLSPSASSFIVSCNSTLSPVPHR
ncbi:hypothetical protein ACLOJK_008141 [Asimina triloba]